MFAMVAIMEELKTHVPNFARNWERMDTEQRDAVYERLKNCIKNSLLENL